MPGTHSVCCILFFRNVTRTLPATLCDSSMYWLQTQARAESLCAARLEGCAVAGRRLLLQRQAVKTLGLMRK